MTTQPRRLRQPRRVARKSSSAASFRSMAIIARSRPLLANQVLKFSGDFTCAMGVPTMATSSVEPRIMLTSRVLGVVLEARVARTGQGNNAGVGRLMR
ncbi:hypothetical protein D3C81_1235530 [compost metagenome]